MRFGRPPSSVCRRNAWWSWGSRWRCKIGRLIPGAWMRCALILATLSFQAFPGEPAFAQGSGPGSAPAAVARQFCVNCHNEKTKSGDLVLEGAPLSDVGAHAEVWEKALRKVRAGAMPPAGMPRPDARVTAEFV